MSTENTKGLAAMDDKDLEGVSGGYVHYNPAGGSTPYELIDDFNGDLLGAFSNEQDCLNSARMNGLSTRYITTDQLNQLRRR